MSNDRKRYKSNKAQARAFSVKRGKSATSRWVLLGAAAIVLLVAFGIIGGFFLLSQPTGKPGEDVVIEIVGGSGTAAIAEALAQEDVIGNALVFRVLSRLDGADGTYKAGLYRFAQNTDYREVMKSLQRGPLQKYVTVTIPEGLTVRQTAELLAKHTAISADEFETLARSGAPEYADQYSFLEDAYADSLEGYLFPDTYRIDEFAQAQDVISMMLSRFDEVWQSIKVSSQRYKKYSVGELVTIASLVEREARIAKERPLVASVIDNRLKVGMKLQFCSSVQFLLPGEEDRTKIRLTNEDISIKSPYNTYLNKGLPPGPIANPGKAALQAAAKPANTDYIYFVLTGKDGSQTFASTAQEFEAAKALSKKVLGE